MYERIRTGTKLQMFCGSEGQVNFKIIKVSFKAL